MGRGRGAKRAWCKESVVKRRARVQRVSTAPSGSSSDRVSAPVWPWWAWWAWCARGLVRKKSVVQGERGARRAGCKESSAVQGEQRGATTEEMSACCGACVAKRAWCERRGANDGKREKRARPPLADRQAVFLGSWGHVVRAAASRSRGERPLRKRGGVAVWCKVSVVQGERGEETSAC